MSSRPADPPPSSPPQPSRGGRRAIARVPRSTIALLLVSIVLPLALFGLAAIQNQRDVVRAAEHRVERTTRILHEHAMKVFETHQLMLDQINERLRGMDWSDAADVDSLRALLVHLRQLLPQVSDIMITDAKGDVRVNSSRLPDRAATNVADRDYFRALERSDQALPYVSRTAIGRITGVPIFSMAARVKGPVAGRFDGVVAIAIEQSYFNAFYHETEREYAHLVILARTDGNVLVSEPPMEMLALPTGTLMHSAVTSPFHAKLRPSIVDNQNRIFGYQKVGAYPVVVGFGLSWNSAMAPWWRNMLGYGLVAVLSSLALLGVSGFAIRRIALEGRATLRWRETAAKLREEIAGRARVEEQLRQSQKMEAVGRLTGGIAHDFNNLLTVVVGSLDMLSRRMKDADPRHRDLVKNAIDGATRAAGLTARLLAFSRQQPLDPKPVQIDALIEGMSNMLARTLRESVAIDYRLGADVGRALVDANQLENAILNLCVNAVDAMPHGGTLTLATEEVVLDAAAGAAREDLAAGRYLAVAIADTGTGMAQDVIARAFEPFFTTKPVGKGTGLGLSQVYGFARQSGGHAEIASSLGEGTTIRILLPCVEAGAQPEAMPQAVQPSRIASVYGAKVLVVEDDDLVRRFSSTALREAGYRVVEAATGSEGLQRLAEHDDIVLLFSDVVLKGSMNGREMVDAARATRPDLPVLFTTGYTKDAIVHDGRLDQGCNLLGKPFTAAALTARVADLIEGCTADAPAAFPEAEMARSAAG